MNVLYLILSSTCAFDVAEMCLWVGWGVGAGYVCVSVALVNRVDVTSADHTCLTVSGVVCSKVVLIFGGLFCLGCLGCLIWIVLAGLFWLGCFIDASTIR